jgi:hypothetical protein
MIKKLGVILFVFFLAVPCFGKARWYNATSHLGGADGSADSISGQNLFDGDKLIVVTITNTYFYTLDDDSAASEDSTSYTVISPDSNAGDKRWVLETISYDNAFTTFTDSDADPTVANENLFKTNTTGVTITRFDNGIVGQTITIISKGAVVYDTSTATRLIGSSIDITTASGDVSMWVCETAGTTSSVWRLIKWTDVSEDNS